MYSQDGSVFQAQLTTDAEGVATTDLPEGTYWVRFFKTGYSFQSKLLVGVSSTLTNTFDIEGRDMIELPPSAADNICRVSGYTVDASGLPFGRAYFQFMTTGSKRVTSNRLITGEKVNAAANSDGYIEVELIQGLQYDCTFSGYKDEVFPVYVPKLQQAHITDLIFPYGKKVTCSSPVSITAGEEAIEHPALFTLSSGIELPIVAEEGNSPGTFFTVEVSDDKLKATLYDDYIGLSASAAGTYTVTITSSDPYSSYRTASVTGVVKQITVVAS